MKFSVVMPVLNGAQYLDAAIKSVTAQTHDNWELLIMDGGSTDGSVEIAESYASADPRIHISSGPDGGIYDAILTGFDKTQGDWLSWLNSDDLYAPWCFATIKHYAERRQCDWLIGYAGCWDSEGRFRYARPAGLHPRRLIASGWFHDELLGFLQQESMFFSRRLFNKLTPEDLMRVKTMRLAGDFLLWRRLSSHAPLYTIPSVLGGFRRHASNASALAAEAYKNEVRETKIFEPPRLFANMIATPFRLLSAWSMMRAAAREDNLLNAELNSSESGR